MESFTNLVTRFISSSYAFSVAVSVICLWALAGPIVGYTDTWQLIINTSTTIVSFLMLFLLQRSSYKESEALQAKLDELIRALAPARNEIIGLENKPEAVICKTKQEIEAMAEAKDSTVVPSTLEVTEASESRKQALTECSLPDGSLKKLLEEEGKAHENTTGNDGRPSGSGDRQSS